MAKRYAAIYDKQKRDKHLSSLKDGKALKMDADATTINHVEAAPSIKVGQGNVEDAPSPEGMVWQERHDAAKEAEALKKAEALKEAAAATRSPAKGNSKPTEVEAAMETLAGPKQEQVHEADSEETAASVVERVLKLKLRPVDATTLSPDLLCTCLSSRPGTTLSVEPAQKLTRCASVVSAQGWTELLATEPPPIVDATSALAACQAAVVRVASDALQSYISDSLFSSRDNLDPVLATLHTVPVCLLEAAFRTMPASESTRLFEGFFTDILAEHLSNAKLANEAGANGWGTVLTALEALLRVPMAAQGFAARLEAEIQQGVVATAGTALAFGIQPEGALQRDSTGVFDSHEAVGLDTWRFTMKQALFAGMKVPGCRSVLLRYIGALLEAPEPQP